jgi:uncharacterized phage protein (TIGR01671 family)
MTQMEIKFRAWETEDARHRMFSWKEIKGEFSQFLISDDTIPMQFTGIKDKEGNDVYEGDIIMDLLTKAVYLVKIGFCKKYAYTGVYGEDLEGNQVRINNDSDESNNIFISVIGNIYENENLLAQ